MKCLRKMYKVTIDNRHCYFGNFESVQPEYYNIKIVNGVDQIVNGADNGNSMKVYKAKQIQELPIFRLNGEIYQCDYGNTPNKLDSTSQYNVDFDTDESIYDYVLCVNPEKFISIFGLTAYCDDYLSYRDFYDDIVHDVFHAVNINRILLVCFDHMCTALSKRVPEIITLDDAIEELRSDNVIVYDKDFGQEVYFYYSRECDSKDSVFRGFGLVGFANRLTTMQFGEIAVSKCYYCHPDNGLIIYDDITGMVVGFGEYAKGAYKYQVPLVYVLSTANIRIPKPFLIKYNEDGSVISIEHAEFPFMNECRNMLSYSKTPLTDI